MRFDSHSLPSPCATTMGSTNSGLRPVSQAVNFCICDVDSGTKAGILLGKTTTKHHDYHELSKLKYFLDFARNMTRNVNSKYYCILTAVPFLECSTCEGNMTPAISTYNIIAKDISSVDTDD